MIASLVPLLHSKLASEAFYGPPLLDDSEVAFVLKMLSSLGFLIETAVAVG